MLGDPEKTSKYHLIFWTVTFEVYSAETAYHGNY